MFCGPPRQHDSVVKGVHLWLMRVAAVALMERGALKPGEHIGSRRSHALHHRLLIPQVENKHGRLGLHGANDVTQSDCAKRETDGETTFSCAEVRSDFNAVPSRTFFLFFVYLV